jgi:nicotinate-nucleotide--dimethylbenzimidazole phosphoribosyltransferase
MSLLDRTIAAVLPLDAAALADAAERNDRLTKPRGALGALEDAASGWPASPASARRRSRSRRPSSSSRPITACTRRASRRGRRRSPRRWWPTSWAGGARSTRSPRRSARRRRRGRRGRVRLDGSPDLHRLAVRRGTGNLAVEPAMAVAEARATIEVGIAVAAG